MSVRKLFLAFSLCHVVVLFAPRVVAEDPKPQDRSAADESFGELKPYGAEDNALLPSTEESKDKVREASKKKWDSHSVLAASNSPEAIAAMESILCVNELGDPKRIVFKDVRQFSHDELRHALARDLTYQAAARPTEMTADLLAVLEQRLRYGYRHCGCPDARVSANFDRESHRIVVQVEEGPRFRQGYIEVVGPGNIEKEAIVRWLTTPQQPPTWTYLVNDRLLDTWTTKEKAEGHGRYGEAASPSSASHPTNVMQTAKDVENVTFWEPGKVFDFTHFDDAKLNGGIQQALLLVGCTKCEFKTELKRNVKEGVANLQIIIPASTSKLSIAKISVEGLKRDTRDGLLRYLGIATGDHLTAELLKRIRSKLSESCRYWTYGVAINIAQEPGADAADGAADLRLSVEEYEPAPPLDEPLTPKQETMRKCATWLKTLSSNFGENDLVCTTEAVELGGGLQQAQFALATDGTLAIRGTLQSTVGVRADHTLFVGRRGFEVYDWKGKSKFISPISGLPEFQLKMRCDHNADGSQAASTTIGYTAKSDSKNLEGVDSYIDFQVEPAALLRLADLTGVKSTSADGTLTIEDEVFLLRIDEATGAVQSIKSASFLSAGVAAIDLKSEKGFVAKLHADAHQKASGFTNAFDDLNPWGSIAEYALVQLQKQPALQEKPAFATACRHAVRALKNPLVRERLALLSRDRDDVRPQNERFWIPFDLPGAPMLGWQGTAYFFLPYVADEAFPRGSWPWTFCRELAFGVFAQSDDSDIALKERQKLANEFVRVERGNDYGPCGNLAMAKINRRYILNIGEKTAAKLAAKGLGDLSDEAFLKDVHLLTRGDHGLAVACRAIAEQCDGLSDEELEEFQIYMPAEALDALKRLAARRKAKPEEVPSDAIEAVLLDCWHNGLKDVVEAELRGMSSSVARVPEGATK